MAMTWGGARDGAGRPPQRARSSEPHKIRPAFDARHPVHVTARVVSAVGSLRRGRAPHAIRRAVRSSLARADFRIVQLAIRSNRIELIVEADHRIALARGMQGFQIVVARSLNRTLPRTGNVFPDRYRARILRTRVAVHALIAALPDRRGTPAWPQTWLIRIELDRGVRRAGLDPG